MMSRELVRDRCRSMDELTEINTAPFTGVLLVLLTVLMVMAAMLPQPGFAWGFHPCGCDEPIGRGPDANITISRTGLMKLDGHIETSTSIYPALRQLHMKHPDVHVWIEGEPNTPYGLVVRVMDAAKAESIEHVGFFTK